MNREPRILGADGASAVGTVSAERLAEFLHLVATVVRYDDAAALVSDLSGRLDSDSSVGWRYADGRGWLSLRVTRRDPSTFVFTATGPLAGLVVWSDGALG